MNNSNITLNEKDIWIDEDFSNDHDVPNMGKYVYCPHLPWYATIAEAKQVKQQILENQEKAKYLDYIIQDKILSKDLVHFMNFATGSEMFDKLFKDEEFTTHWYAMLRRLEKLQ